MVKLLGAAVIWVCNFLQSPAGHELVDQATQWLEDTIERLDPELDDLDADTGHPDQASAGAPPTPETVVGKKSTWREA